MLELHEKISLRDQLLPPQPHSSEITSDKFFKAAQESSVQTQVYYLHCFANRVILLFATVLIITTL